MGVADRPNDELGIALDCPEGTDPRVARSKAAIIEATIDLMVEGGLADLSVDAIAERAGVSKATIYRHWESRQHVVMDALTALKREEAIPDTGSLRGDLVQMLTAIAEHLGTPSASIYSVLCGIAEHDPELAEMRRTFSAARRLGMLSLVERAIERGDLPADVDVELFIGRLVGPLFYMRMTRGETPPSHWPEQLVDAALAAPLP